MITSWIPSNDYKNKTNPLLDAIRRSVVLLCVFGLLTWKYDMIMKAVLRTGLSRSFCLFCPVQETNSYQPKLNYCPVHDQTTRNVSSQNMYAFSSLQINKIQQNKLIFALGGLTHRSRVLWPYIVYLLIQIICSRHKKHMNIQNYVATTAAKHYRKQHTVESELKWSSPSQSDNHDQPMLAITLAMLSSIKHSKTSLYQVTHKLTTLLRLTDSLTLVSSAE